MMQAGFCEGSTMTSFNHSSNGWESLCVETNRNWVSVKERVSVLSQAGGRPWMGERERETKRIEDPIAYDCNLEALAFVVRKLTVRPRDVRSLAKRRKGMKWPCAM
ncbi:hypothetical protein SUGI_0073220 [Cryptomeria japonica]|nr:hypothetical protein SUGI_0073220 [Cryptomeria japonica]